MGVGAPTVNLDDIAYDDKHDVYLHVWGIAPYVFGRFVDAQGLTVGAPFRISTVDKLWGQYPRVAYSTGTSDDVFFVAFSSDANVADKSLNVFAQLIRYTTEGPQFVGGNFPISEQSSNPAVAQTAGGVVYNPTLRRFFVTWGDSRGGYDVYGRAFTASGQPVGPDVNISNAPNWQGAPNVAFDARSNRYLVAYQGEHPSSAVLLGSWAKIIDGTTNTPISGLIEVSRGDFQAQQNVIYLPESGQFLVCWTHIRRDGTDVSARIVDASGNLTSNVYPIVATPVFDGAPDGEYSASTRTVLVGAMHDSGYAWASELDAAGGVLSTFQGSTVRPNPRGGTFWPRVAAGAKGQFVLGYILDYASVWVERFQGTVVSDGGSGGSAPPPPTTYAVTVQRNGDGSVTATGINCGTDCTERYTAGTRVVLTPTAAAGSVFSGWAGPEDCLDGVVDVNSDITCTADFNRDLGAAHRRVADPNGDALGDVFLYNQQTGVWFIAHGDDGGLWNLSRGVWSANWTIKAAHLNGDGLTDYFLYNTTSGEWVQALSDGAGQFRYTSGLWSPDWQVHVGRFNVDAFDDVFLYNVADGQWFVVLVNGSGGVARYVYGRWDPGYRLYVARLDAFPTDDLFLYHQNGIWFRAFSDSNGGFTYNSGVWSPDWDVAIADLNGDSIDDLFLYRSSDGLWVSALNTVTGFNYRIDRMEIGWRVFVASLNRDNRDDIFLYNEATGLWLSALSDGAGGFSSYVGGRWSPDWQVHVSDFDGDQVQDILVYNRTTGIWVKCFSNQAGGFTRYLVGDWGPNWTIVAGR